MKFLLQVRFNGADNVIGELFASGRKLSSPLWNGWGIGIGFFAGLLTDFILIAVGA